MKTKEESRTIKLPQVGNRRAELTINLRTHKAQNGQRTVDLIPVTQIYWVFSASGGIEYYNRRWHKGSWGQVIEEIAAMYPDNQEVQRIAEIWREWHLNDLNAGTTQQAAAIDKHKTDYPDWRYDYGEACELLKTIGLYEDRGYKYGHAWLLKVMPYDVKKEILDLIKKGRRNKMTTRTNPREGKRMSIHYAGEILKALKKALKEIKRLNEHRNETPDEFIEYLEMVINQAK